MDLIRDINNREVPVFVIFDEDEDRDVVITALSSQGLIEDHRYPINQGRLIIKFKAV